MRQQQLQQQYAQRMPQLQAMQAPRGPPQPPMAGMFPQGAAFPPQGGFYGPPPPSGMPRPPQGPGPMGMYPPMMAGRMPMPVSALPPPAPLLCLACVRRLEAVNFSCDRAGFPCTCYSPQAPHPASKKPQSSWHKSSVLSGCTLLAGMSSCTCTQVILLLIAHEGRVYAPTLAQT